MFQAAQKGRVGTCELAQLDLDPVWLQTCVNNKARYIEKHANSYLRPLVSSRQNFVCSADLAHYVTVCIFPFGFEGQ